MPAVSTNTSTLSGVAYCWSFQLMTTWNPARYVLLARRRWLDICKNSDYMTQATLAQVAILVQTITSEFLKWTGRCCLYPLNGSSGLLLLAGNCLPYHQPEFLATKDSKKALGFSRFLFTLPVWGFRLHTSLGGPKTEHPCWLPASPDASDASDVIQRSPSHVTQD